MIKKVKNYLIIPIAICALLNLALKPQESLNIEVYSTKGLNLNYDMARLDDSHHINQIQLANPFQSSFVYFPHLGKSYIGFKEALAFKESRGNYFTVNTLGYLGKYQFGAETLKLIGIYNPNQFLYNPKLQEKAFLANAERNKWILRKDIKRFEGKTIAGVEVTESGIIAAAHLAGPGSVKKFLRSYGRKNVSDAYGSSVRYYMMKFSGYDTSFIEADKKAKAVL
ncbi:MAG: hypothetical protein ACJARX_000787 [Psychroserpens sp.]|jgi:hypothetical protein|uniref:peptidoglycan-binding protein LysM n=1 Tax=Psychroserpens sp. TaxID=2020870 RepID=UPI0039E624BE